MTNHELDSILDKAVASYGVEPSAELVSRILLETNAKGRRAAKRYKTWRGVGVAAAALLMFFVMHRSAQHRPSGNLTSIAESPQTERSQAPEPVRANMHFQRNHHVRLEQSLHGPAAMTEQEKLLAALATRHPDQALALIAMNAEDAKPIEERAPALNRSKELDVEALPLLTDKPLPMLATGSETQN